MIAVQAPVRRRPDNLCVVSNVGDDTVRSSLNEAVVPQRAAPSIESWYKMLFPLGDATIVERRVPGLDGRRLTAVYPDYACRERSRADQPDSGLFRPFQLPECCPVDNPDQPLA